MRKISRNKTKKYVDVCRFYPTQTILIITIIIDDLVSRTWNYCSILFLFLKNMIFINFPMARRTKVQPLILIPHRRERGRRVGTLDPAFISRPYGPNRSVCREFVCWQYLYCSNPYWYISQLSTVNHHERKICLVFCGRLGRTGQCVENNYIIQIFATPNA